MRLRGGNAVCKDSSKAEAWGMETGFVCAGALLSTVSYNEGQSIPGIAHAVVLERMEG